MFVSYLCVAADDERRLLWEIGTADNDTSELALGPDGYGRYTKDPLFVVGTSDPKRDWPYVQPGPADTWAGGRQHDFVVVFSLGEVPDAGDKKRGQATF